MAESQVSVQTHVRLGDGSLIARHEKMQPSYPGSETACMGNPLKHGWRTTIFIYTMSTKDARSEFLLSPKKS